MPQPFDKNNSEGTSSDAVISAEDWREVVKTLVKSVKFGSVQIAVQDGKVIQIDSTEKIRLDQPQTKGSSGKKWTSGSGR
jgi:hypothetical protein